MLKSSDGNGLRKETAMFLSLWHSDSVLSK